MSEQRNRTAHHPPVYGWDFYGNEYAGNHDPCPWPVGETEVTKQTVLRNSGLVVYGDPMRPLVRRGSGCYAARVRGTGGATPFAGYWLVRERTVLGTFNAAVALHLFAIWCVEYYIEHGVQQPSRKTQLRELVESKKQNTGYEFLKLNDGPNVYGSAGVANVRMSSRVENALCWPWPVRCASNTSSYVYEALTGRNRKYDFEHAGRNKLLELLAQEYRRCQFAPEESGYRASTFDGDGDRSEYTLRRPANGPVV